MTRLSLFIIVIAMLTGTVAAQTDTTVTYQGRLADAGEPADGTFDLEFGLWDAASGGNAIGVPHVLNNTPVTDGLFTVQIDFGADAFDNTDRWLEITVDGIVLLPRQPITCAPYAIQTRGIFVNEAGQIGIGTTSPISMLELDSGVATHGIRSTVPWIAVFGHRASTTGTWPGVHGECDSLAGSASGVRGLITSTSPGVNSAGVRGVNNGTGTIGAGVYGWQGGDGYGVYGEIADNGIGVYGQHSSTSGDEPGVMGKTNSTTMQSTGVLGVAAAGSGYTHGVRGRSYSTNGTGVTGRAMASTGIASGVFGQSDSTGGIGVSGWAANGSGVTYGGRFTAASSAGTGVFALHDSGNGTAPAVMGRTDSDDGYAVGVHGLVNRTEAGSFSAAVRGENLSQTQLGIGVWGSQNGGGWGVYGSCPTGVGVRGSGGAWGVYSDGNVYTTGSYMSASDARLKQEVQPLTDSLSTILKLRGVEFDWKRDAYPDRQLEEGRQVGFIAQEVAEVLPEVVTKGDGHDGFYSVSYDRLTPVVVEAIKELHGEVQKKDAQITNLQSRLAALEARLERLATQQNGGIQ